MFKYWDLVKHLTLREIKARYKQSFLGLFWVILNPFFQMLILSFVFSNIMRFPDLGVPYPVFLYAGLLPWIYFNMALGASTDVLINNSPLIKKIYFPREILVLSSLLAKTFDFFLSSILFIALLLFFKITFTWYMLMFIPIFMIQFIFTYGLGLLLSSLNLFYRDVQFLFNLILTMWFYLTPVLYATEFFPQEYRWIFKINPMSVFINAYRQVLLGGSMPNWGSLFIGAAISIFLFTASYMLFKRLEGAFADVA